MSTAGGHPRHRVRPSSRQDQTKSEQGADSSICADIRRRMLLWRKHVVLAPDVPGRSSCARCGRLSGRPLAFERRPCMPPVTFPAAAVSAVRRGVHSRADAATPVAVGPSCAALQMVKGASGAQGHQRWVCRPSSRLGGGAGAGAARCGVGPLDIVRRTAEFSVARATDESRRLASPRWAFWGLPASSARFPPALKLARNMWALRPHVDRCPLCGAAARPMFAQLFDCGVLSPCVASRGVADRSA